MEGLVNFFSYFLLLVFTEKAAILFKDFDVICSQQALLIWKSELCPKVRGNTIFLFAWRGQSFQMCKCWRINHVFFFFTILCFLTLSVTCTTSCYRYLSVTCNFCYQYLILLLEPLSHKYISITCTFLLPVPFCYSHLSFTFIIYPSMLSVLIMLISILMLIQYSRSPKCGFHSLKLMT